MPLVRKSHNTFIAFILFSSLFVSANALAVRGWLGGSVGGFYADNTGKKTTQGSQKGIAGGATLGFVVGNFVIIGGRIEAYADSSDESSGSYTRLSRGDIVHEIIAPHAMLRLPLGFLQLYAGGVAGLDIGFTFNVANTDTFMDSALMYGPVAGIDIFLAKAFSIGAEAQYHKVRFEGAHFSRSVYQVTFKWQFGNK